VKFVVVVVAVVFLMTFELGHVVVVLVVVVQ